MNESPNPLLAVLIAITMILVAEAAIRKERSLLIALLRSLGS